MEIAKVLKDLRVQSGLSQGAVAKKLGYTSPQFVSNWERAISVPPVGTVKALAKIYACESLPDTFIECDLQVRREELINKFKRGR